MSLGPSVPLVPHTLDEEALRGLNKSRRVSRVEVDANRISSCVMFLCLDIELGRGVHRATGSQTLHARDRCILSGSLGAEQEAASDIRKGGGRSVGQCSPTREEYQK